MVTRLTSTVGSTQDVETQRRTCFTCKCLYLNIIIPCLIVCARHHSCCTPCYIFKFWRENSSHSCPCHNAPSHEVMSLPLISLVSPHPVLVPHSILGYPHPFSALTVSWGYPYSPHPFLVPHSILVPYSLTRSWFLTSYLVRQGQLNAESLWLLTRRNTETDVFHLQVSVFKYNHSMSHRLCSSSFLLHSMLHLQVLAGKLITFVPMSQRGQTGDSCVSAGHVCST